jgi:putative acetyltransferase
MKIRQATQKDEAAIRTLIYSVLKEYGLKSDPNGVDADLGDIPGNYAGGLFELYEDDHGKLLGSAALYKLTATTCELRKMYLAPEARGRGQGKWILERMLEKARVMGFTRVELETASCLKEAIQLYRRYGFRPMPGKHLAERCDQAFFLGFCSQSSIY